MEDRGLAPLIFTHREADEEKFPSFCQRVAPLESRLVVAFSAGAQSPTRGAEASTLEISLPLRGAGVAEHDNCITMRR